MRTLYTLLTHIAYAFIQVAQLFSKKLNLFVQGRKESFTILSSNLQPQDRPIWFHCASLGEYEQGVPIMEACKKQYPNQKIVVTFFSPSGYEIKKNSALADAVVYLPFDTKTNAKKFVSLVNPKLALFVKYEFWPNYLLQLKSNDIPALLISGLFRKNQIFFKPYGGFMRKALKTIEHFFVQDTSSQVLLKDLQLDNVTVTGDTRFDRVSHQIEQDNTLSFVDNFKGDSICVVCGSNWPDDDEVLLPYINSSPNHVRFIMAPHKLDTAKIESFRNRLDHSSVLYSEKVGKNLTDYKVLIVDTIGYLTKIYSYADIAYVGGAMGGTGLHNILEPATFGVPIVIGRNFNTFPEAQRLQQLAGLFSVSNPKECSEILNKLVSDKNFRQKTGMIAGHFVNSNTGATRMVMEYLKSRI